MAGENHHHQSLEPQHSCHGTSHLFAGGGCSEHHRTFTSLSLAYTHGMQEHRPIVATKMFQALANVPYQRRWPPAKNYSYITNVSDSRNYTHPKVRIWEKIREAYIEKVGFGPNLRIHWLASLCCLQKILSKENITHKGERELLQDEKCADRTKESQNMVLWKVRRSKWQAVKDWSWASQVAQW